MCSSILRKGGRVFLLLFFVEEIFFSYSKKGRAGIPPVLVEEKRMVVFRAFLPSSGTILPKVAMDRSAAFDLELGLGIYRKPETLNPTPHP